MTHEGQALLEAYVGGVSMDGMAMFLFDDHVCLSFESHMLNFPLIVGDPSLWLL